MKHFGKDIELKGEKLKENQDIKIWLMNYKNLLIIIKKKLKNSKGKEWTIK